MLQTVKSTTQIYRWVLTGHDQYFVALSSDVISWGNQWYEISAVY